MMEFFIFVWAFIGILVFGRFLDTRVKTKMTWKVCIIALMCGPVTFAFIVGYCINEVTLYINTKLVSWCDKE